MWGYVIIGITLLSSQHVATKVWNMRLLRTAKWAELGSPTGAESNQAFEGGDLNEGGDSTAANRNTNGPVSFGNNVSGGGGGPRASSPQLDSSCNGFRDERLSTISGEFSTVMLVVFFSVATVL